MRKRGDTAGSGRQVFQAPSSWFSLGDLPVSLSSLLSHWFILVLDTFLDFAFKIGFLVAQDAFEFTT